MMDSMNVIRSTWLMMVLVGVLLSLLVAGALLHFRGFNSKAQDTIVLSDGSTLQIRDVTYGTNHVYGTTWARIVWNLPPAVRFSFLTRAVGDIYQLQTAQPELRIWFDFKFPGTNTGPTSGFAWCGASFATENEFTAGQEQSFIPTTSISSAGFTAWPRRTRMLNLFVSEKVSHGQGRVSKIALKNPSYQEWPQWQPEGLPATKNAGDLEVTLVRFGTGLSASSVIHGDRGMTITSYELRKAGEENHSFCEVAFRQNSSPASAWQLTAATLTDATGNSLPSSSMGWSDNNQITFSPSLWPDESAWKLRCEVKRTKGFTTNELFTFKSVPLPALNETNGSYLTTNFHGIAVTMTRLFHNPPVNRDGRPRQDDNSWSLMLTNSLPRPGVYLDLISIEAEGKVLQTGRASRGNINQSYMVDAFPESAKTVDITFAVHQSRTVEFLVSPNLAKAPLSITNFPSAGTSLSK
jgi:hypothetical protein